MRNLDVPTHHLETIKRQISVASTNVFGEKKGHATCTLAPQVRAEDFCIRNKGSYKSLTLRLLMSYIYGAPSKARNANVVYKWTYVWQR